jgi:anaerobic dimethyl sulfoxide reductase subunit C (anchor subunit)
MFSEEWPLMLFTLLTQLAVGSYIFFVAIRSCHKKIDKQVCLKMTSLGMTIVGPVMLVALILSVFHLGTPTGAYRALLNLDSSWLSREILFAGLFFVLWIVGFALEKKGSWNQALGWINSIVGIVAIFSMASIYAASIMPAWSNVNTYLAFFGTTIVFGATSTALLILINKEKKTPGVIAVLKVTGVIGVLAIALQLVYLPIYSSALSAGGSAAMESATLVSGSYVITTILRWILSIAGVGVFVYALFRNAKPSYTNFMYAAIALVLVGEFIGRYLFYATGVPINVG